ncbi:winged helix-turn-helix domain-containing protein [Herbaspirillum sp. alder98]|uniref:winged helix-turn-helix domain-containing protein n=1 Tax=Herbaspirillum sp. alder98 TaxID=2913096 RepID=UPI001CD84C38|nr:winged helix-turn-helix domain-containing protein [Herbaspirillum sp. alder98]MCA1324442.1 winged helix-turn-helix domain-containing protein [Herbaspirillum sp. alder98]
MGSNKRKKHIDIYVRFLELIESIRDLPTLDPLEEKIFGHITKALHADDTLSVTDVTGRASLGSPVTIHVRLKSLVAKGWISLSETEDGRRKQINLTEAAQVHLTKVSQCLVKAVSNSHSG